MASHTDSLGNTQTFLFNIVRLENQTTDPRGFTTVYRHDQKGNLVERRDPDGAIWSWVYDSSRNVVQEIDPSAAGASSRASMRRGTRARSSIETPNR